MGQLNSNVHAEPHHGGAVAPRDVAAQVVFERHTLKPVFFT
jgi:hypothetical protein